MIWFQDFLFWLDHQEIGFRSPCEFWTYAVGIWCGVILIQQCSRWRHPKSR